MGNFIFDPAREMLVRIINLVIVGLGALLVIIVGWIISKAVRSLVARVLKVVKLDKLSERVGIAKFLAKGEVKYTISDLVALIIYWILMLVVIMVTADVLGLSAVAELLDKVILYIPNVIAALFILIIGSLVAVFLRKIVETTAKNAGLTKANTMGMIANTIIIIFAAIISLEQLKIGITFLSQFISVILGSIGLALALAFGLGCKDIAAKAMQDFLEKTKTKK